MSQQKYLLLFTFFLISNSSFIANPQQSPEIAFQDSNDANSAVIIEPQKPTTTLAQAQQKTFDVAVKTKLKKPFDRKLFVRRLIRIGVPTAAIAIVIAIVVWAWRNPHQRHQIWMIGDTFWTGNQVLSFFERLISVFGRL